MQAAQGPAAITASSPVASPAATSVVAAPSTPAPPLAQNDELYFGKVVSEVAIEGLKRIEKEAVLAKIGTKPGNVLRRDQIRSDIQSVFNLGHFDDIAVQSEPAGPTQVNLIFVVRERPVIAQLNFEGNEKLGASDLKDVVKVKEWSILDINKVKEDVVRIQRHYEEKGFYLAKVSFEVQQRGADEVELTYRINDYEKVQIKKITFLNNKHFSDEQLKVVLGETREGGPFSFLSGSGNFKESAFKQDLQRLTYWYLDHGFVKFKYDNPVVTISDDKKWLFISIYVDEGEPYKMGSLDFSGDLLFPKDELQSELSLPSDVTFSISKRNTDIQHLTEKYQDLGYAFVNVIPKMNIHDDTKTVDIDYSFEKGNLVYFGEINVYNNTKTYDKVIRRELRIHEGELYSGTKMRQSREAVERLGYFSPGEVAFNTVSPKDKPDVLNVEITVKERSTGTITLGAGYGSYQGFFFTTQVSEINFLGRGQTLSLAAQYSIQQISQSFNLGFSEPYTFDSRWVTGFDLYHIKMPIPYRWITQKNGFDLRVGHPIAEFTNALMTYKMEGIQDLNPYPGTSIDPSLIQADSGLLSSVTFSIVRDKRNNRFETTGGNYQSFSTEVAGLGGDLQFVKWVANNRFYHRVIGDLVFRNNIEFGQVAGYGGKATPPSQKFYLGGPNNMKGYQIFLLGPQAAPIVATDGSGALIPQPIGGNIEAFSLFELEYPLLKEAGIKLVVFFDVGNAWDHWPSGANSDPFVIRTDAGFGLRWFSPIGPLRFEWGFPFAQKAGEQSPCFQFFIGPPF